MFGFIIEEIEIRGGGKRLVIETIKGLMRDVFRENNLRRFY